MESERVEANKSTDPPSLETLERLRNRQRGTPPPWAVDLAELRPEVERLQAELDEIKGRGAPYQAPDAEVERLQRSERIAAKIITDLQAELDATRGALVAILETATAAYSTLGAPVALASALYVIKMTARSILVSSERGTDAD